ncbi:MAG: hypothetical protein HP490_10025, partial [Nitrospira sp.]|nr:hypothetical protein [Nitrospira sp.]
HRELHPKIVGEFDDSMTLKTFGQDGYGIFPGATAIEKEICRQYRVQVVGQLDSLKQHFYAITVQRRLTHPSLSCKQPDEIYSIKALLLGEWGNEVREPASSGE